MGTRSSQQYTALMLCASLKRTALSVRFPFSSLASPHSHSPLSPSPDIVLMDLQMPILNGLDATLGIRQIEKNSPIPPNEQRPSHLLNRGIPVIAVTASLAERDRDTIVDAKLDGWLRAFSPFAPVFSILFADSSFPTSATQSNPSTLNVCALSCKGRWIAR
jgi:CheY-like chemotaxis protein